MTDPLLRKLQPSTPNAPNGPTHGLAAREPVEPLPGPTVPDVGRRGGPVAADTQLAVTPVQSLIGRIVAPPVPAAMQAQLTGEPGTLPEVWCRTCATMVVPEGKGVCPRCKTFTRLNFLARKHPVNKLRRQQLLDKFLAEYRPIGARLHATCEQLAEIEEQRESQKAGSLDYQRLVQQSQYLFEILETSLATRKAHSPDKLTAVDQMPSSALHLAHDLLTRLVNGEELSERELGRLDVLRSAMDGTVLLPPDPRTPELPYRSEARAESAAPASTSRPVSARAQPAPEPTCDYCHLSLTRCDEIKETRLDTWRALHYHHPEEAQRREAELREHALDDIDARAFLSTGIPTAHMREKDDARQPKASAEELRQAEIRRKLGWDEGVLNERTGYRRHE